MKKVVSILILMLTLSLIPLKTVTAASISQGTSPSTMSLIKQKRQIINGEIKKHNKLHNQINKKSTQVDNLLNALAKDNLLLTESKFAQLEDKENEITKVVSKIIQADKKIELLNKEISTHMNHQSEEQVLSSFDELIAVLEKKTELLKLHNKTLEDFVEFIKSLSYK